MHEEDPDEPVGSVVESLRDARTAHAEAEAAVEEVGLETIEAIEDARTSLQAILDRYEDRAVGTESFGAFLQFRAELDRFIASLSEELPERDRFETIAERFEKRRLNEDDFAWASEQLSTLASYRSRLEDERSAAERKRAAARRAAALGEELEERLDRLDRLATAVEGDLDLSTPPSTLKDAIDRYNDRVTTAVDTFRHEATARAFAAFLRTAERYPLIEVTSLPDDVEQYLASHDAGTESIDTLLTYAEYSRSKLAHYVDDPDALKRTIATQRTAIERRDATPFRIAWPPPPAEALIWHLRELLPLVRRFADDETVRALRAIRALVTADRDRYERDRTVARLRADLTPAERALVADGDLDAERQRLRAALDRLAEARSEPAERT